MIYTGSCACETVTATISGPALAVRQCWCRQCQKIAAGSPTTNAMFATQGITIDGALATTSYVAASGNTLTRSFCGGCGTPILAQSSARPQFRMVRLGFLDPGHGLVPNVAIWTEEAPAWAAIDPALEAYSRQAPPPPVS